MLKRCCIVLVTALVALGGFSSCKIRFQSTDDGKEVSGQSWHWRLVTTWPPHFPIMGEGLDEFARQVSTMSGGRMTIQVFGAGELIPALEIFDAVSQGTAEMGHGAAYYWVGKVPAAQFFCTVPFGMNAQQMNTWLTEGGGLKLWTDLYARYNLVPFPAGNTGVQMGGWFNKPIRSVEDLKGLKIRMPGLGGKVLSELGATAVLVPGSELYTNLERGVIDAAEWIGPYHDYLMGFHRIARYYYYPGWHEPGPTLELMINKTAWESLPPDLQAIIRSAAANLNDYMLSRFEARNREYLEKIRQSGTVDILPFPDEVMSALRAKTKTVLETLVKTDQESAKVYESYRSFQEKSVTWSEMSEIPYYLQIGRQ